MNDNALRTMLAFALAPLVPPSIFWAATNGHLGSYIVFVTVGSLVSTYPLTLVIGVPSYFLIRKHGTLRLRHVLAISGAVGFFAVGVVTASVVASLVGAALGLSAGITFWVIWYRRSSERSPF
jgi:hypothetical protein